MLPSIYLQYLAAAPQLQGVFTPNYPVGYTQTTQLVTGGAASPSWSINSNQPTNRATPVEKTHPRLDRLPPAVKKWMGLMEDEWLSYI